MSYVRYLTSEEHNNMHSCSDTQHAAVKASSCRSGTVDLQGYETSVLLLSCSNLCVTWSQARF